jgi:hypothetical protein
MVRGVRMGRNVHIAGSTIMLAVTTLLPCCKSPKVATMPVPSIILWIAGAVVMLLSLPTARAEIQIDPSTFEPEDIIERDVAIIGGGASGAHAAFRLVEDFGKSVVVVEKESLLVCFFLSSGPWPSLFASCVLAYWG